MLKTIAEEISLRLVANKIISIDKRKYYTFGIELALNDFFIFLSLILIAVFSKKILISLIYIITYCSIRNYVGGYHCKTYLKCFCTTLILYSSMLLFDTYLKDIKFIIAYILMCVSTPIIIVFTPIDYDKDPISSETKKKYKKKSIILITIASVGFVLANIFHKVDISFAISWGVFMVFSLMLLSVFLNLTESRRKNNGEKPNAEVSFPPGGTRD